MPATKRTAQDLSTVGAEEAANGGGSKKRKGGVSASPALEEAAKHLKVGRDEANTGILIEFASDESIHIALGLAHSPIPQGADALASAASLREWFAASYSHCIIFPSTHLIACSRARLQITAVSPNSAVPVADGSKFAGFHHLDFAMFMECLAALNVDGW